MKMKDIIIDSLAIYGGYSLIRGYWNRNKDRITKTVGDHISKIVKEAIKEAINDPENPMTINVSLGGK